MKVEAAKRFMLEGASAIWHISVEQHVFCCFDVKSDIKGKLQFWILPLAFSCGHHDDCYDIRMNFNRK